MSTLSRVIFDADITAPSVPGGLTPTVVSASRIDLGWNPSVDTGGSGLAGYELQRDLTTTIPIGVQTSYSDTGLSTATQYSYRVRARDGNSNFSAYSGIVNATTQGASSSNPYASIDARPTTHVAGTQASTGTGSEASPFNAAQAKAFNPNGAAACIEFLGGNYDFANANADVRLPVFGPDFSGTAANPYIWRARNRAALSASGRSSIRRTGGGGSIFGLSGRAWNVLDGFEVPTSANPSVAGSGETSLFSFWNVSNSKLIRCVGNAQGSSYGGGNYAVLYAETISGMEIGDCTFSNITGSQNNALVMFYDESDVDLHHNELHTALSASHGIWSKGQHNKPNAVLRNRFHHNLVRNCMQGIDISNPLMGSTLSQATWIYQNVIRDCHWQSVIRQFSANEPSGVVFVNNTFARATTFSATEFLPTHFLLFAGGGLETSFAQPLAVFRNNICSGSSWSTSANFSNWASVYENLDIDRNLHHNYSSSMFNDQTTNRNFAYWQALQSALGQFNDINGLNGIDPLFVNLAGNDLRLQAASQARGLGRDYLNLLGGGTSAVINAGAYITSDMSDQIGPRT